MSLQDSRLLVAGTISAVNNAITGYAASGNITTTAAPGPYSVDLNPLTGLAGGSGIDIGEGTPLYLKYTITTTFSGGGITGLNVSVVNDSNANLTATPATLATQAAPALTAGTIGYIVVPPQIASNGQEFIGAYFQAVGGNPTAGAIIAEFTNQVDDPKSYYKSGFTVA